ncbi:MAG: glutamate--tRNA ligase [Bacteroidales bacterium]|nr:glutamate--tRNA ligase [Bacteroidales bacterium]
MGERKRRVRFAPSPTGPLHMGGVRTALYNYLYAKQGGGDFIIRIEDTDSQRFVPSAEKYIIDSLNWCGIIPDEGVDAQGNVVETPSERHPHAPYRQSQRKPIYRAYAEQLIANGYAYYAFDTAEELDAKRKEAEASKQNFIYNYQTRKELKNSLTLPEDEVKRLLETTTNWTIRFKNPEDEIVKMDDLIRGHIEVNTNTIDDKVLWKRADELPTYHLANIVDDHLMEITEVIRGEEWLPSLPLHYMLYKAFGWSDTQPRFAHLSLLLKPDGKGKLSKRDGDRLGFPVFPLKWVNAEGEVSRGYREDGYYPEAFVNLLALLGWNPGTEQELFTMDELVKAFSLERVIKSGARFNADKAKWFNQEYLRKQTDAQLAEQFIPILAANGVDTSRYPFAFVEQLCGLIKERAHFVADFWDICSYFFIAPTEYAENDVKKFCTPETMEIIGKVKQFIADMQIKEFATAEGTPKTECVQEIEEKLTGYIRENEWKMGAVMNTLRLFFVGQAKGLGIADIIYFVGKEEALKRITAGENAI